MKEFEKPTVEIKELITEEIATGGVGTSGEIPDDL